MGKKRSTQKNVRRRRPRRCNYWPIIYMQTTVQSFPSILAREILSASDSELRRRRSSGVRLAYTDPSGERQRAPSTPRWGPSSLQRSFRRPIASTVHAAVGSVQHIEILPASDSELRSHVFLGEQTFLFQKQNKQKSRGI